MQNHPNPPINLTSEPWGGANTVLTPGTNRGIHEIETHELRQLPGRETVPGFCLIGRRDRNDAPFPPESMIARIDTHCYLGLRPSHAVGSTHEIPRGDVNPLFF